MSVPSWGSPKHELSSCISASRQLALCQRRGLPLSACIPLLNLVLSSSCPWLLSHPCPAKVQTQSSPSHRVPKPLPPLLPQVVCARCSDYRAELKYDDNRPNRVCLACYTFLTGNVLPEDKDDKRRGILEVRATPPHSANVHRTPTTAGTVLGAEEKPAEATLSLLSLPFTPSPTRAGPATKGKQLLTPGCGPGSPPSPLGPHPDGTASPHRACPRSHPCPTVLGAEESWCY